MKQSQSTETEIDLSMDLGQIHAIRVEHVIHQRKPQRGEGDLRQPRVLPAACRVPHDLTVAQVDQQDTEGRARLPRDVRHDARAAGQAGGLRALVQHLQDSFDVRVHNPS